jgi:hypothetical protein
MEYTERLCVLEWGTWSMAYTERLCVPEWGTWSMAYTERLCVPEWGTWSTAYIKSHYCVPECGKISGKSIQIIRIKTAAGLLEF